MKARRGQSVLLDGAGIACPAAAAAFGFRPLPEGLCNGSELVGFAIVADASVGQRMFQEMPTLPAGQIHSLHVFPLEQAEALPDVIVIEDEMALPVPRRWFCWMPRDKFSGSRMSV